LQFYCNGHSWLAKQLTREGIDFTMLDNAFVRIENWAQAQSFADALQPDALHRILDRHARQCCPVLDVFGQRYHWSLMQVEYSTDLVFRSETSLKPLYEQLSREAVLAVKAEQVASFLGKKITPLLAQEIGSRFATRIEGTCIKHRFGKTGVKMYDKFGCVLRLETTTNDVSFFKHHRKVEHRDAHATRELAPLKKSIYSLIDLREILLACNRRYLEFLSAIKDTSSGERDLVRLSQTQQDGERTIKGLNFFQRTEQQLLRALQRPEFNIHGMRRADLKPYVDALSESALSRQLRRMRFLGLIKRVAHTYRYYLTRLGRAAIAAACSITQFALVPEMACAKCRFLCQYCHL
jgi:DNA-binding HxlR family transcriptional regulator